VHYSIFVELNIPGYRLEHAKTNLQSLGADGKDTAAARARFQGAALRFRASPFAFGQLFGIAS
jgi:hypothetical protein